MCEYFSENCLLYKHQFGFREHHSTSLALISVLGEIYHSVTATMHHVIYFNKTQKWA